MSTNDWPSGRSCGTRIADPALDELVEWQLRHVLEAAHQTATEHHAPILGEHGEHLSIADRIAVLGRAAENRRIEIDRMRAERDGALAAVEDAEERIAELRAELAAERDRFAELFERAADQPRTAKCLFCGWSAPVESSELAAMATEHWRTCERHPIHVLTAEVARLKAEQGSARRMAGEQWKRAVDYESALGDAFVAGAKWWEYERSGGFTMWQSDQQEAAEEAARRGMPFRPSFEEYLHRQIDRLTEILQAAETEIARLETELDRERKLVAEMDRQRIQMGESLLRSAETSSRAAVRGRDSICA